MYYNKVKKYIFTSYKNWIYWDSRIYVFPHFQIYEKDDVIIIHVRLDGRKAGELRRIQTRMGVFKQADGSAYLEQGNTKVLLFFGLNFFYSVLGRYFRIILPRLDFKQKYYRKSSILSFYGSPLRHIFE